MTPDVPVTLPPPRAHHAGTVALLRALAGEEAGDALVLVGPPDGLPADLPPAERTLKWDVYAAVGPDDPGGGPGRAVWGVAVGERWEPGFEGRARAFLEARGYPWGDVDVLRAATGPLSLVVALGYDRPGHPPRAKVYLQETQWGASGLTLGGLAGRLPLGLVPPVDLPETLRVGVACVELAPGRTLGVKLYVDLPPALPAPLRALAPVWGPPVPGTFDYLTVRLRPGAPARYSLNHIHPHVTGYRDGSGWAAVGALFRAAGRGEALDALRSRVAVPGLRVVPTASALDDDGSVDVYLAGWAT